MTTDQAELEADVVMDESRGGLAMLVIFTASVLVVTGAVVVVGLVGTWWLLGVAMAVHLLVTTGVIATIAHVMSDGPAKAPSMSTAAEARRPRRPARAGRRIATAQSAWLSGLKSRTYSSG